MIENRCPRCFNAKGFGVEEIPDVDDAKHYQCKDPDCRNKLTGERTQFRVVYDKKVQFPYSVIFKDRPRKEFYRKPYLVISSPGISVQRSQSLTSSLASETS